MPERAEELAAVEEQGGEDQPSVRPFWSGTISFGLVSVPVDLFAANRSSHVGLRMLAPDGTPLRRRYFSLATDRELRPEDMVRGYPVEPDRYVVVTDEELERLAPEKSRDIDLRQFVPQEDLPPLYFERSYFLAPSGDSAKAYRLLAATMEKTKRAGIATFVMRGKEYLIAIVAENGILRAETLRFQDELRTPADVGLPSKDHVDAERVERYQKLIAKHARPELAVKELRDEAADRLLQIVKEKQTHRENVVETAEAEQGEPEAIDLLDVLKRSLASAAGKAPRRPPRRVEADEYAQLSRADLLKQAKARKIPRRSSMTKEELIQAIRQAS